MRRTALLAVVVAALVAGTLLLAFAVSPYNVRGQRFDRSLVDFAYAVGLATSVAVGARRPPLTDDRLDFALGRLRPTTSEEVAAAIEFYFARYGNEAIAPLAARIASADPWQLAGIARLLGAIGGAEAVEPLLAIAYHPLASERRHAGTIRFPVVTALGKTHSRAAADALIAIDRKWPDGSQGWGALVLDAIGETGHGTEYLLDIAARAPSTEALRHAAWALARSHDPRAMRFLADLLEQHADLDVRRTVRDALDQLAGDAALPAVVEVLKGTRDEVIQSWIIHEILADRRGSAEAARAVAPFLEHSSPAISRSAYYALTRIGNAQARDLLLEAASRQPARVVLQSIEFAGSGMLDLVKRYLASSDASERRLALAALPAMHDPAVLALVVPLLDDPDPGVREEAAAMKLHFEKLAAWKNLTSLMPGVIGRGFYGELRPKPRPLAGPLEPMLPFVRGLHQAGIVLSALVAAALLFGFVRTVESYRFDLFTVLLLTEGFIGDFFLHDIELDGARPFVATAAHLALLAGVLLQPREYLPGESAGRFERLAGVSVWLLLPLVIVYSAPMLGEAVRSAFTRDWWCVAMVGLFAAATMFAIEQWALPRTLLPRDAALERSLGNLLWIALTLLLLSAMLMLAEAKGRSGHADDAAFALIAAAPLAWALACRLARPRGHRVQRQSLEAIPGGRFDAIDKRDEVVLALRPSHPVRRTAFMAAVALATPAIVAVMAGPSWQVTMWAFSLMLAPIGAALAAIALALWFPAYLVQIRDGAVRGVVSRAGVAFGRVPWKRRLDLPPSFYARLGGGAREDDGTVRRPLSDAELLWIADVAAGGHGHVTWAGIEVPRASSTAGRGVPERVS